MREQKVSRFFLIYCCVLVICVFPILHELFQKGKLDINLLLGRIPGLEFFSAHVCSSEICFLSILSYICRKKKVWIA